MELKFVLKSLTKNHYTLLCICVCIWILFSWNIGFFKIIQYPPYGIHQGAQADRASIALNYYQHKQEFKKPMVHESRNTGGITGCEFPIINYTVSKLYQYFGYNHLWYRALMYLIFSLGFLILLMQVIKCYQHYYFTIITFFIWASSPILTFYIPNFLPDMASLGLLLLSTALLIKNHNLKNLKLIIFILLHILAVLIKVTSIVFSISILGAIVLIQFNNIRTWLKALVIFMYIIIPVYLWYSYAQNLSKTYNSSFFLLESVFPSSWQESKSWFFIFVNNWKKAIYSYWVYLFIIVMAVLICKKVKKSFLWYNAILSTIGTLCFYLSMQGQFRYHDYYMILAMLVFLNWFLVFIENYRHQKWVLIFSFTICILGYIHGKKHFEMRYEKGNYWNQTYFYPEQFKNIDATKQNLGLNLNTPVMLGYDANPNVLLYQLNLHGYRLYNHDSNYINNFIEHEGKWIIVNDTTRLFNKNNNLRLKLELKAYKHELFFFKTHQ